MQLALRRARTATDTQPTEAQKQAGNYAKGKLRLHGIEISIENPKGSIRTGVSPDGKRWSSRLAHDYGYIKRTEGADGDHLDVFIGPDPSSELVVVVDQVKPNGRFDEHKCLLGFSNVDAARAGYLANYQRGWRCGPTTTLTVDQFKQWLREGDLTQPMRPRVRLVVKTQLPVRHRLVLFQRRQSPSTEGHR